MTKYKVRGVTFPTMERTVKADELQHYKESDHWRVIGESSHTPGANVQTDDPEDNEAEELALADVKDEYKGESGDTVSIDPDSYYGRKYLTEAERESLREPEDKKPIEEVWAEVEEDVNQLREQQKAEEQRQSIQRAVENRDWLKDTADKPLNELTAGEFAELMQGDAPDSVKDELMELAESEETEPDHVAEVDPMTAELAAQSFSERGGYWADIAEDIRTEELGGNDVDSVKIESHDGGQTIAKKRSDGSAVLKTEHPVTREELADVMDVDSGQNVHQVSDVDGQLTVEIDSLEKLEETLA